MAKGRARTVQEQCVEVGVGGVAGGCGAASGAESVVGPGADTRVLKRAQRKRKHYTGRSQGADETQRLNEVRMKLSRLLPRIRGIARELVAEVYGEAGPEWGTRFRDIEILSDVIGMEVASRFTERAVDGQAASVPEEACVCPGCRGHGRRRQEDAPRSMRTLTGVVDWSESEFYCDACRRSFFPSESRPGD